MKKLDKGLVDSVIRTTQRYFTEKYDSEVANETLTKMRESGERLEQKTNYYLAGMVEQMAYYTLRTNGNDQQIYDALKVLGYEVGE